MIDHAGWAGAFTSRRELFLGSARNTAKMCFEAGETGFCGSVVSDIGCVRLTNEDNYALDGHMNANMEEHSEASVSLSKTSGKWWLAGVFDGMGGGEMGELAARDAAEIFREAFRGIGSNLPKDEVDSIVRKAFLRANNRIVDLREKYNVYGTTGTVIASNGFDFKIYHLGDSRAYIFRENDLFQLTKDQTLAQMKIDSGIYGPDDPDADADRHKLTEYIGRDWTRENIRPVESQWIPVRLGDGVLICSDGLYGMCSDEEITGILRRAGDLDEKCAMLVDRARRHGGVDNITSILIWFCG